MNRILSKGLRIKLESFYQHQISRPSASAFVFAYLITIENAGPFSIELNKRSWRILNGDGTSAGISEETVLPAWSVLGSGDSFRCLCLCELPTEVGRIQDHFILARTEGGKTLRLRMPSIDLVVPFKHN